jgi:ABC-2 type transport system permease protein
MNGRFAALLELERGSNGDLAFTLYSNDTASSRAAQLARTAAASVAVSDRMSRLGIASQDQAGLFAPPAFDIRWPDPAKAGAPEDNVTFSTRYLLGFGMTILIFMMIILYGQWIAMSVVEEKLTRVMEVVLNAATPLDLMTGKVLGVGAVALLQYGALLATSLAALVLQAPLHDLVLGQGGGGVALPEGLTPGVLLLFGVYGVLGFLLYGVLYAAAGSLVSRQEDVQTVIMPLAIISTAGYLIATYGATGLLDSSSPVLVGLAQVPFLSPFMMLSRATGGQVTVPEILLSVAFLVAMIGIALVIASRLYAAGVLLYGQRPGMRSIWRILRTPA